MRSPYHDFTLYWRQREDLSSNIWIHCLVHARNILLCILRCRFVRAVLSCFLSVPWTKERVMKQCFIALLSYGVDSNG